MKRIDTAPPVAVPSQSDLRRDKYVLVMKDRLRHKLASLGFEWCPQLSLFLHYDPRGRMYEIASAIAIVGKNGHARAFKLR